MDLGNLTSSEVDTSKGPTVSGVCTRCHNVRTRLKQAKGAGVSKHLPTLGLSWSRTAFYILWTLVLLVKHGTCQETLEFYLEENKPIGTVVGIVRDANFPPNYTVDNSLTKFTISEYEGVISVNGEIDREEKESYSIFVLSKRNKYREVRILITDVNDNSPQFILRESVQSLTLSETANLNSKIPLGSVVDPDRGINSTQGCEIVSGNTEGTFQLETSRQQENLVLDLVVNNNLGLDYEESPFFSILLRAFDGGSPPKSSTVRINVTLLDENDNEPSFAHSYYAARVPENASIGAVVMHVTATDRDSGNNGRIHYEIDYALSDFTEAFQVNASTGTIYVHRALDYESKRNYKVVILARDSGVQAREGSTVVAINITDVNDNPPNIELLFLSQEDRNKGVGHVTENTTPGESYIARISVSDEDVSSPDISVTLHGGDDYFGLVTQDNTVYLITLDEMIDREQTPYFNMTITAVDSGDPPLTSRKAFSIEVSDINDNAPSFEESTYHAHIQEGVPPGASVIHLTAIDPDTNQNSLLVYEILNTPDTNSDWFQIDRNTGLITTKSRVDCETHSEPRLVVVATDSGSPVMSGSATVIIGIRNVNDNPPRFDQSSYNASVMENAAIGSCIITVSAEDQDCGDGQVIFSIPNNLGFQVPGELEIRDTGELCLVSALDHERQQVYEFQVMARDQSEGGDNSNGLYDTAIVKIHVSDVNDNRPVFKQSSYNLNLARDTDVFSVIVNVEAEDRDSGSYGQVTYSISSGSQNGLFAIGSTSGVVTLQRTLPPTVSQYTLAIQATDGGGQSASSDTQIRISILDPASPQPEFTQLVYQFTVPENANRFTLVGTVSASTTAASVTYSIVGGDPHGYFSISPTTGEIRTDAALDHDEVPSVVLSIQAEAGQTPAYGQAQAKIIITDINDNSPQFSVSGSSISLSVKEDASVNSEVYWPRASDKDSGLNSRLSYHLDDPSGHFGIIGGTGQIKLAQSLDHEAQTRHRLVVTATDSGTPPRSSSLELLVSVQDVNDNAPVFDKNVYQFRVSENVEINREFAQVRATDGDSANNGRVTYLIQDSNDLEVFGIFADTGYLYNKRKLDRETQDSYSLQVVAVDNGIPSKSATASVHITVLDANDNSPVFMNTPYQFLVEENRPPSTGVGYVTATDIDKSEGLIFTIQPESEYFSIDREGGEILTKRQLDRERQERHPVTVIVSDRGNPPRSSSIDFVIRVLDLNDNSPMFSRAGHYMARIREKKPKGTTVTTVSASDADSGPNGLITYSLLRDEHNLDWQMFQVHPKTGKVTTNDILDHESKPQYVFKVVAQDGGTPPRSSMATIEVGVDDENENPPVFSSSHENFQVVENTPPGSVVGSVKARDADTGPNVRVYYYIISGNLYSTFGVNKTTGSIYIARPVDFEECSEYAMQIMAIDNDPQNPLSNVVSVNISIIDRNDNTPTFEINPLIVVVSENIGLNSHITTLTAMDMDSGPRGAIKYTIEAQSRNTDMVTIDPDTGYLYTNAVFDYEQMTQISITVKAQDQPVDEPSLFSTISVRILLEDKNDNAPVFQSRSEVFIFEDEPVGYPVMHVIATDQDSHENGNVSYAITSGNQEGHFYLDTFSGLLKIISMLDRETTEFYLLGIKAYDLGHPRHTSHMNLTITVIDKNDNPPVFDHSVYRVNITENNAIGAPITRIRATDRDQGVNAELEYFIPNGLLDNKFSINSTTGEIFCHVILDREVQDSWLITAYVRDGAFPVLYDTATVLVTVLDLNDNMPAFHETMYSLEVPENAHYSVIHTIKATDLDEGQNGEITYLITDGDPENKFQLNPSTGQLSCQPLDREDSSTYNLSIKATDGGTPTHMAHTKMYIKVNDVNDNNPQFEEAFYTASIPEDTVHGTVVLEVKATDADEGLNSVISYSINNAAQGLFKIDNITGIITTAGEFDREKKASYTFEVYAIDGGLYGPRSRSVRVDIQITDINDHSPEFVEVPYKAEIGQNFDINSIVTTVLATDRDAGPNGTVRYSLSKPDANFKVDNITGEIRTQKWLTDVTEGTYVLDVLAHDQGPPPGRQSMGYVEIKIGNIPSSSPLRFTNMSYHVSLVEHAPRGTAVTTVNAQLASRDTTAITYSFGGGNENGAFSINQDTGYITVNDPTQLDYEMTRRLRLIVVANSQNADGYTAVWIHLQDANDNSPSFTQDRYTSSVWEGNPRGTYVTQVIATDMDDGINSQIEYVIIGGNTDKAFTISPPNTGIVKTNQILDREIDSSYKLIVEARDGGSTPRSSTAILKIQVVDENDNVPLFEPNAAKHLREGAELGTEVIKVIANDGDLSPALTYTFTPGGNPGEVFSIDRYSGRIALSKPLDYEQQTKYTLRVMASDTKHNDTTEVVVHIDDENDNSPQFSQSSYEVTIPEMTVANVTVIVVNATDEDSGENARITYTMLPIDGFYISHTTGTIYTNKTIHYMSNQPIHLVVTATDHGAPSEAAVVPVQVRVIDINNNAPSFIPMNHIIEVSESAEKGHDVTVVLASDADHLPDNKKIDYSITVGNEEAIFDINQSTGKILLVGTLDHEHTKQYKLTVMARDRGQPPLSSTTTITVNVKDVNDNRPEFTLSEYTAEIREDAQILANVTQVLAYDSDSDLNGRVQYQIFSGNDYNNFEIDRDTGVISVKTPLDHETAALQRLSIRASDSSIEYTKQSVLCTVIINVTDVNEFPPDFPLVMYIRDVMELKDPGTFVFQAIAYDKDSGRFGILTYRLENEQGNFQIDSHTGEVSTARVLNYTVAKEHRFDIVARDSGNYEARILTVINVLPQVKPQFTNPNYNFIVPGNAKAGHHIGKVQAFDKNGNPANLIRYSLKEDTEYFTVNVTSGDIFVLKDLQSDDSRRKRHLRLRTRRALEQDNMTLVVIASAGHPNLFPSAEAHLLLQVDRTCDGCAVGAVTPGGGLSTTALALIIAFVIVAIILGIVILVMCLRGRDRKGHLAEQSQYDSSSFETLDVPPPPMRGSFAPPPYNEANAYPHLHHHHNLTTSEISDQSRSASSGRGSADEADDVDEEIRMINATPLQTQGLRMPDSGIQQDDDNVSEHSVHNHQEYLARLGIDTSKFKINSTATTTVKSGVSTSVESMHQFSDEGGGEGDGLDIGNLVYSKLGEVTANEDLAAMDGTHQFGYGDNDKSSAGSLASVINSDEEFSGSYNWDYLLDWGPQYQPLADVFSEIARLKDDTVKPKTKPTHIVPQHRGGPIQAPLPQQRVNGPPPMITDTPPKAVPMGPLGLLNSHKPSQSQTSLHSSKSGNSARTSQLTSVSLPKSPLSYESSFTSPAMSPSFTPSLSPLATRSPSISPLVTPKGIGSGHTTPLRQDPHGLMLPHASSSSEQEIQI